LELLADADEVVLRVRDDGAGIPQAELDRIFDHFYTTKPTGTGLGLSIVKRLVSDFEGRIRVESRPGEGTVFEVRLPRGKGAPE
jgi:signal transduction histidine kinase